MAESKFRYEITAIQNGIQVGLPFDLAEVNDPEFIVTETRENGQFFYIKKIKSKLTLIKSDYQYFISKFGQCFKYYITVYKRCENTEVNVGRGYFSDIDLEINLDTCSMEVSLNDNSAYNCIKKNGGKQVDIFAGVQTANTFLEVTPQLYRTADWLLAILFINGQMNCCNDFGCYVSVRSDFFNWQPDGFGGTILVDDQAFTNYVNPAQPNYYLRIAQKSDIKNPTASNPATKLLMSFQDVEKIMRDYFNCYWVLEGLYIRWEHYSWFTRFMNYDATSATNFPLNEYKNKLKLDSEEIPSSEIWKFMEANGVDFVGTPLLYNPDCSNGEELERGFETLTTDTDFIISNPNKIDNNGFVLIDCFKVNSTPEWFVYSNVGQLSLGLTRNVRLSSANLQYDLHRYGRPLIVGTMNNLFQTFLSTEPNIIQEDIITQLCCTDDFEKWDSSVRTELGFGKIDEAEINYTKEQIKFKLRHDSIG